MTDNRVAAIIEKHGGEKGSVIAILEAIQKEYRYLPQSALQTVSRETSRPLTEIYGVATFYRAFSLKPRGKHVISICMGTACHVKTAPLIVEEFERQLNIKAGENTPDNEFTLETVNCLGACALGPIVLADGRYFSKVDPSRVKKIIHDVQTGFSDKDIRQDTRVFPLQLKCSHCNHSLMDPHHLVDGYPSIRVTISFGSHHGWLRLSCLYGSHNVESDHEIPMDTLLHIFCPHCHDEFISSSNCLECGAPLVPMIVKQGGVIQVCSRRGCKAHRLDLDGANL